MGTASIAGVGTVTASSVVIWSGVGTASGVATLTAAGVETDSGVATISATATLTANGRIQGNNWTAVPVGDNTWLTIG